MGYSILFLLWLRSLLPLLILAIAFYLLIFKPLEKQRIAQAFVQTLAPGMRVRTNDGRGGVISIILHSTVIVAFDSGTKAEIAKSILTRDPSV